MWNPGADPILSSLLRAFDIERPRAPKMVPQWNLALVLQAFLEEPFEPLETCLMKFLTWKTAFLVALAAARRVSCLHALSLEPDPQIPDLPGSLRFGRHKCDVTIFTNPAFVAKNQKTEGNPPVVIKSLRSFIASQDEPDNKLCPVRALLYYLKRTQQRRGTCFRLFLPYTVGPIQAQFSVQVDQVCHQAGILNSWKLLFYSRLSWDLSPRSQGCCCLMGGLQ